MTIAERLRAFDWNYERSDDPRVYQKFKAERVMLYAELKALTKDEAADLVVLNVPDQHQMLLLSEVLRDIERRLSRCDLGDSTESKKGPESGQT